MGLWYSSNTRPWHGRVRGAIPRRSTMKKIKSVVYVSDLDSFVFPNEAVMPITDIAFQRAIGVFEALLVVNGKTISLTDHLKRLKHSAKALGIHFPWSFSFLEKKALEGIKIIGLKEVAVRILITGGDSEYLLPSQKPRLYIWVKEEPIPEDLYTKGVAVHISQLHRIVPKIKSLNYVNRFSCLRSCKEAGVL